MPNRVSLPVAPSTSLLSSPELGLIPQESLSAGLRQEALYGYASNASFFFISSRMLSSLATCSYFLGLCCMHGDNRP